MLRGAQLSGVSVAKIPPPLCLNPHYMVKTFTDLLESPLPPSLSPRLANATANYMSATNPFVI